MDVRGCVARSHCYLESERLAYGDEELLLGRQRLLLPQLRPHRGDHSCPEPPANSLASVVVIRLPPGVVDAAKLRRLQEPVDLRSSQQLRQPLETDRSAWRHDSKRGLQRCEQRESGGRKERRSPFTCSQ